MKKRWFGLIIGIVLFLLWIIIALFLSIQRSPVNSSIQRVLVDSSFFTFPFIEPSGYLLLLGLAIIGFLIGLAFEKRTCSLRNINTKNPKKN